MDGLFINNVQSTRHTRTLGCKFRTFRHTHGHSVLTCNDAVGGAGHATSMSSPNSSSHVHWKLPSSSSTVSTPWWTSPCLPAKDSSNAQSLPCSAALVFPWSVSPNSGSMSVKNPPGSTLPSSTTPGGNVSSSWSDMNERSNSRSVPPAASCSWMVISWRRGVLGRGASGCWTSVAAFLFLLEPGALITDA